MTTNIENARRYCTSREKLCEKVAALPVDCTLDQARDELEPLVHEAVVAISENTDIDISCTISPLMVASDKGNVASLRYFSQPRKSKIHENNDTNMMLVVGRPLDTTDDETLGGNSAVHHAAMSNCAPALELFHQFGNDCNDYRTLGAVTNAHGDTPLHMAAMAGHLEFLQTWYKLVQNEKNGHDSSLSSSNLGSILQMENMSGDTCISLACCHGQLDILKFFLEEARPIIISHEEIQKCEQAVTRICKSVNQCNITDPSTLQSLKTRKDQMCSGLEYLKQAYAKQVEHNTRDLLLAEAQLASKEKLPLEREEQARACKKSKKKKKEGKQKGNRGGTNPNAPRYDTSISKSGMETDVKDNMQLTRLPDGKLAISAPGETFNINENTEFSRLMKIPEPTVDDMFRQRLHDGASTAPDSGIDAVMDALCLDVSMLLYTPHGMALNLSPSQLEAVEQILEKQILAAREAREIKSRMHQA